MKKMLAVLIMLTLVVSCLPTAFAEEGASTAEATKPVRHILVVYFSATSTTKGVAEKLAEGLSADLYEIVPEEPYTDADLNYNNSKSRTSIETDDPSCRPAIAGELPDLSAYDTILVGYPIWWGGRAPHRLQFCGKRGSDRQDPGGVLYLRQQRLGQQHEAPGGAGRRGHLAGG